MRDALGPHTMLGYCTNVHAGETLDEIKANLDRHAVAVKRRVCPDQPLGIGLWLPAGATRELREDRALTTFRGWLDERGLAVFTINGFPYGGFHERVVKHRVYEPSWATRERLDYTTDLIHILAGLAAPDGEGSISTLPIGWKDDVGTNELHTAAEHLREAVQVMAAVEADTGCLVHLDLEPEPGCALQRSEDVVSFFENHLLNGAADEDLIRRHLRVCHDICHAAVMFEEQSEVLRRYAAAGIAVG